MSSSSESISSCTPGYYETEGPTNWNATRGAWNGTVYNADANGNWEVRLATFEGSPLIDVNPIRIRVTIQSTNGGLPAINYARIYDLSDNIIYDSGSIAVSDLNPFDIIMIPTYIGPKFNAIRFNSGGSFNINSVELYADCDTTSFSSSSISSSSSSSSNSSSSSSESAAGGAFSYLDINYENPPGGNYEAVSTDGNFIYAARGNYGLASHSVDGSGNLTLIDRDDQFVGGTYSDIWIGTMGGTEHIFVGGAALLSYSVDVLGNLTFIDSDDQGASYAGMWGDGTYLYVAVYGSGMMTYSVDGLGNLTHLHTLDNGGTYYDMWGDGTFVFVANDSLGVRCYEPDAGGNLIYRHRLDNGGNYKAVWSDGNFIYCACGSGGLKTYSVNGSGIFTFIDSDYQGQSYDDVWGDGTYIYCACNSGGIRSYEVDGSGYLTHLNTDYQGGIYYNVWGDGTFVYTTINGALNGLASYSVS
jgi:hypothetical protein